MERKCDEISYKILGTDLQLVETELDAGETVIGEAGAMVYMSQGLSAKAKLGDGSEAAFNVVSKIVSALKRKMIQESVFLTHFNNPTGVTKTVAFGSSIPGKIVPIDLAEYGECVVAQKTAFLCAAKGTRISLAFAKRLSAGLFGGEGFVLQSLQGDGMVFLAAGGMVVEKQLEDETLIVETGSIVAMESTIQYSIARSGGLATMLWGGEGVFLSTLSGTGKVWIQSLPFSKLAEHIYAHAPVEEYQDDGR